MNQEQKRSGSSKARAGGTANEPILDKSVSELTVSELVGILRRLLNGGEGGAHVNSGPPGHVNEPGHANFDPSEQLSGEASQIFAGEISRTGADAGPVHVNSGPPGHVNEPGHANFDPMPGFEQVLSDDLVFSLPDGRRVTLPSGSAAINVRGLQVFR